MARSLLEICGSRLQTAVLALLSVSGDETDQKTMMIKPYSAAQLPPSHHDLPVRQPRELFGCTRACTMGAGGRAGSQSQPAALNNTSYEVSPPPSALLSEG